MLHYACAYGNQEISQILLEQGASVNLIDKGGQAPLHVAADRENTNLVLLLLDSNPSSEVVNQCKVNQYWGEPITLLHWACARGLGQIVRRLLERGAHVNLLANKVDTPLHMAARKGDCEVVQQLLNASANPNIQNAEGNTPLHVAAKGGQEGVIKLLLEQKYKAHVNLQNEDGNTPLHMWALRGRGSAGIDRIGYLLLECGADPDIKNMLDSTVHDYARFAENSAFQNALLNYSAKNAH